MHIITRQAIHLERNIETRSCNNFSSGKAINFTLSESACIQNAMCMRQIVNLWRALLYNFLPHYLIYVTIFERKSYLTYNVRSDSFYIVCLKHFSFWENKARCDQKCIMFITESALYIRFQWNFIFLDRFFKKFSNIKCHDIPSSWSRVSWGRTDRQACSETRRSE
jgi:hypothetical protein